MADIALDTTRSVNLVFVENAEIRDFKILEELTVGQVAYIAASGKAGVADANDAGKQQARGLVVKRIGNTVSLLKRGYVSGFVLTGQAYDCQIFLSNTAGAMGDSAGAMSVPVGRVSNLNNDSLTKILYVDFDWITQWT
jgi:hypothetical protein